MSKKKSSSDRNARLAEIQRQQKSSERRRMLAIYGSTAVVAALIIGLTTWALLRSSDPDVTGITTYESLSSDHVTGEVEYAQSPPAGGDHNAYWQNCDFYTEPVANEHAVHSLEHGAVWITYQPDLAEAEVEALREEMGSSGYVLMSPYEDQDSPIVLTAWGVQLEVDTADDPKVQDFLNKYIQGPQTLEPGAACSGATSATAEETTLDGQGGMQK